MKKAVIVYREPPPPPKPEVEKVILELTLSDAQTLKDLTAYDITIPDALVRVCGTFDRDKIAGLLGSLRVALWDVKGKADLFKD